MEEFYNNFIFVNKYLKEKRLYTSIIYKGVYRKTHITVSFLKDFNKVSYFNKKELYIETCTIDNLKPLQTYFDKIINKYDLH